MAKTKRGSVESPAPGKCHFCGKAVGGGSYCYGCKQYVCEACDRQCIEHPGFGPHVVSRHQEPCLRCELECELEEMDHGEG